jgi:hypothetical protein
MQFDFCKLQKGIKPIAQGAALGCAALLLFSSSVLAQDYVRDLHRQFETPPADARPMMRWWWFGPAVTKPELQKELETMRNAGIGGVEIQPVYPLMLDDASKGIENSPYMSPQFLDAVRFANKTARGLDMRVDITLGSGWPYGGPKTTLALAAGRLRVVTVPMGAEPTALPALGEGDSLIAAFAVAGTAKEFDPATARRIDVAGGSIPAGTGKQTALIFIASHTRQMVKRPGAGAEGYVLDHFSSAAIDEHLTDVAAPLLEAFGDQPPYSVFSDSLEVYGSDWTVNLPSEFQKRRGYDLIPHLPELLAGGTAQAGSVRHDWGQTLSDLVRENYLARVTQFAKAHGTRFRSQTYGEPAVTLADEATADLPEGEGPQWRAFSFTRWASSASHLYDRNVTSAETWTWLHSPAFRATPLDMKVEADRMFLLGVNQIVGHGYPYSPAAAGEPGWSLYAAAAFNAHNPWFPVMGDVTRYLQRMSWLLRQGKPANDVAILLPEDDVQAGFTPGHVSVTEEMKKRISPELMGTILDAGYNIDYIDAATIDKLNRDSYPVLIMPSVSRISLDTLKKIEGYAGFGGKVIAIGKLPSLAPGLTQQNTSAEIGELSTRLLESANLNVILVDSTEKLADALHHDLAPDMDLQSPAAGVGFIHRRLTDSDVYFVVNSSNRGVDTTVRFRSSRPEVESWNPDAGNLVYATACKPEKFLPLQLAPYESRVFVFHGEAGSKPVQECGHEMVSRHVANTTDVSADWKMRFADQSSTDALKKLTSWTDLDAHKYYSGEVIYTRTVNVAHVPAKDAATFLDFGEGIATVDPRPANAPGTRALLDAPIREAAIVYVNGQRVGSLWHPPYRLDISSFLRAGENQIEVHVYNTAVNEMAGQPRRDYTALNAKYGKRFDPQDMDNLQPIPSGLLGPIRIVEERY